MPSADPNAVGSGRLSTDSPDPRSAAQPIQSAQAVNTERRHSRRQSEHLVNRDLPAATRREQRNHLSHGAGVERPTPPGILVMCIFNTAPTGQNKPAQGNPPWVSKGASAPGMASHPDKNPPRTGRWSPGPSLVGGGSPDPARASTEGLPGPAIEVPPDSLPRVRLLLDDLRTQQLVDLPLQRGAMIVVLVNRPRQPMRPRAIGRKNWLSVGSDRGARTAATCFSILAGARRHRIEPFAYVRDLLRSRHRDESSDQSITSRKISRTRNPSSS